MAVSAVWRMVYFRTLASRTKGADRITQAMPPARRAYGSERRAVPLY